MPTYHVQQTWSAKKAKDGCEPLLGKFTKTSQKQIRRRLQWEHRNLEAETIFEALCPLWLQRERKDWFEVGGHPELNAILLRSRTKIRSNSKLSSFIMTNISRSSRKKTSWFIEVRHQGLLSHVHILIFSKSNLKLQVFGLFSRFVRSVIIKEMVVNLAYLFIPRK